MNISSRFERLPAEIRLRIYAYVFHRFALCQVDFDKENPRYTGRDHQLCRVNKLIRREAVPVLALQTKVIISICFKKALLSPSLTVYKLNFRCEWANSIHILCLNLDRGVPDYNALPNLRAIFRLKLGIFNYGEYALPIKSKIIRIARGYYEGPDPSDPLLARIYYDPLRKAKLWTIVMFFQLRNEDIPGFDALPAEEKDKVAPLWCEVIETPQNHFHRH